MADWARAQSPAAVEEILDRENKRMADSLASKVTRLKSLALDIDRDAEDQNRYLDSMDSDFTSMTGLLTGSMKRFSTMARSGRDNRKLLCEPGGPIQSGQGGQAGDLRGGARAALHCPLQGPAVAAHR
ncbi:BET1-like protein isoform X4 [Ursus americanus]|nr:BET1-like protein isoform X4 [Ursus americanus]